MKSAVPLKGIANPIPDSAQRTVHHVHLPDDRWSWPEIAFWLLPVVAYLALPEYHLLLAHIMIVALFALSLDLILGYAGIVSLGHAAFFGLGAYAAGLLSVHGWGDPLLGLAVAVGVAGIFGYLVSFLVVRGEHLTQLMVTLGIGLMLFEAANKAAFITGGVDGLAGMNVGKLLGVFEFDLFGITAFWYSFAVLFAVFVLLRRIVHSPFGLSLAGLREGERRMPALGANVAQRLTIVFTLGAAIAGAAGALLAQTSQFVALDSLSFARSAELLIILVLGGAGRLYGAVVGAAIFIVAQDLIAGASPVYWQLWLGLLLVVIVLFAKGGVLGAVDRVRAAWRNKQAKEGRA